MRNTFFLTNSNSITRVDLQLCELKRHDTQFIFRGAKRSDNFFLGCVHFTLYPDQKSVFRCEIINT